MHYIYKLTNRVNGRSYIGYTSQTPEKRFKAHCQKAYSNSTNQAIHAAIRKYGSDSFDIETLEISEDGNYLLNEREQYYIDLHDDLYNMGKGGIGGDKSEFIDYTSKKQNSGGYKIQNRKSISEEDKLKISESMKGNSNWTGQTEQSREKMRLANLGKPKTEEAKRKMSEAAKNRAKVKCQHCSKEVSPSNFSRWHGDKCKMKTN